MTKRQGVRVKKVLKKGSGKTGTKVLLPARVRDGLGARFGDTVVYEEGSVWAAEAAAARGKYFILSVERAPNPPAAPAAEAGQPARTPPGDSFEEAVRRKLEGQ